MIKKPYEYGVCDVKNLYTLRDVSVPEYVIRCLSARLFYALGHYGLCDTSGFLWPIVLDLHTCDSDLNSILKNLETHHQSSVSVVVKGLWSQGSFHVQHISDTAGSAQQPWTSTLRPSPIPTEAELTPYKNRSPLVSTYRLTANSRRWTLLRERARLVQLVERFFTLRGFVSVAVPSLVKSGGMERYIETFKTTYTDHQGCVYPMELATSPELSLKKICAEGIPAVFQLGRAFRNAGELGQWHQPEFGMLEWYRARSSLVAIMEDTQNLINTLSNGIFGSGDALPKKWEMYTVEKLFQKLMGLHLTQLQNTQDFICAAQKHSPSVTENDTWDVVFSKLFMEKVEPFLAQQKACFVYNYPLQQSTLARACPDGPFLRRFEGYLYGIEICNGYEELVDGHVLEARVQQIQQERDSPVQVDEAFTQAMAFGLPPLCCGNALGIDRVVSLLLGCHGVADVMSLPFEINKT